MEKINQQELRADLRFEQDSDEFPTYTSISRSICLTVERWGLAPKTRIITHTKKQLTATGFSDESLSRVDEVYDRLKQLGTVEEVYLAGRRYCACAKARWIKLTENLGVLTGTIFDPSIPLVPIDEAAEPIAEIVMRFDASNLDTLATLNANGITQWGLDEWLGEPAYVEHLIRRSPENQTTSLVEFWEVLTGEMADMGLSLSDDAEVRAVVGKPGGFFGQRDATPPTGRWTDTPPDGFWCGIRKGYSDVHWQPILLVVDGEHRRSLELYDFTEWKWALLARGRALGEPEIAKRNGDLVSFTYQLPDDLLRLMRLIGNHQGKWNWKIPVGISELWSRG